MSEYYEVYRRRAGHLGITPQQRAEKSGKLEYKRYEHYSEHTEHGLKCGDKVFNGVILTHKQNENETSLKLLTDVCVGLKVGDLVEWNESLWLVWYKTISSYQPHDKFEIIQCNHVLNWVDKNGEVHNVPCHIVGSQESKIKENFRTWNELITPQPNKFIGVVMPYHDIAKETEVIVFDEAWRLVEYDKVSVPGVIYLSFTETKINPMADDLENSLANADRQQVWSINAPSTIHMKVGDVLKIECTIAKDGIVLNSPEYLPSIVPGAGFTVNELGEIIAAEVCNTTVSLSYKNAYNEVEVIIEEEAAEETGFISGDDYIRVTRSAEYTFVSPNAEDVIFKLQDDTLASITTNGNTCLVKANSKNKMGSVILTAEYHGVIYEKEIRIISLWQEV